MNIKEKFLELTKTTTPYGFENELILPDCLLTDVIGNRYIQIGGTTTMFLAHLDTASKEKQNIKHVIEGDIIRTDGTTILGADDKAGVVILLIMLENKVPGLYYFTVGHEAGGIGSRDLKRRFKVSKPDYINKVISFDRHQTDSVITYQRGMRSCSDIFADALAMSLNEASKRVLDNDTVFQYKKDPNGFGTDSADYIDMYPECTNISVGYENEHQVTELQNIKHLDKLAKTCCLLNWEALPINRDPSRIEYKKLKKRIKMWFVNLFKKIWL